MNKPVLRFCFVLVFAIAMPAVGEAAYANGKARTAASAKKQGVLKAARAVPARMAVAARAARPAGKKPHGVLARHSPAPQKNIVPVAAQSAVLSRPVIVGDASASPSLGAVPGSRKPLPQRMYAADGDTFYFNGRKYRVEGVPGPLAKQEMTKQRLQQLLDSGDVSIEPRAIDDGGMTSAVIRVAGRDVAEALR